VGIGRQLLWVAPRKGGYSDYEGPLQAPDPDDVARGGAASPRILLVAPQPFFRSTGTPFNVLTMCRALTASGFEVHLLTLPHGQDVAMDGLIIHRVWRLPFVRDVRVGFSFPKALYNLVLVGAVLGALIRRRFAAVHAIEEAAFYAVPLGQLFGVPGITDLDSDICRQLREQESGTARALAGPADWLRGVAIRRSAAALAVAPHMAEIARRASRHTRVFEISDIPIEGGNRAPDPVQVEAYRTELGLSDKRLLVYTGNYERHQGLVELVEAMALVVGHHPDAVLVVVGGDRPRMRELQGLVDRLGLGPAVRLVGPRPPDTMAEYMGMAEVLVSPRLERYATPLKIFSYMASGRPIVATDLPTHTAVLDPASAFLVPPTVEGLAAGLRQALDQPGEAARRAARARRRIEQKYTFEIFKGELQAAYAAILGAHHHPLPTLTTPGGLAGRALDLD